MKNKKTASVIIATVLIVTMLTGCSQATNSSSATSSSVSESTVAAVSSVDVSFDSSDYNFDWKSSSFSTLSMSTGSQTITKSGVYEITGTTTDGSLVVDEDKSTDDGTVTLVLNNTSITSATSAPIYVKNAKKVVVILEDGTTNTLSQGSNVTVNSDNEPSAALFSKADLTITGGGTLHVTSDYNDGISCKDELKMTDGTIVVNAKGDGIVGKDVLAIEKGNITITAEKDGLRSTNDTDAGMGCILLKDGTFTITSTNDAIQAAGILQIDGGTYQLTTGGGYAGSIKSNSNFGGNMRDSQSNQTAATQTTESDSTTDGSKCLKADGGIVINGGNITASSYEDAVHSKGSVTIHGGTLTVQSGDQGIQSDNEVVVDGGTIEIQNSYEGIEGKNITITGGDMKLISSDDGFNVNDSSGILTIGGGTIYVNAGGDGLDSNGTIAMTGGSVTVDGPTDNGNGALDSTTGFTISGGSLIATGSSGMAEAPDTNSSQESILMYYSSTQAAGTVVSLKDSSGATLATFTPSKQFISAAISASGLKTGETYTLYSNDTSVVSFTLSDTVTYLNESGITTNQSMGSGGGFSQNGLSGNAQGGRGGGQSHGAPGGNG